jgi:hypothetical protein
MRKMMMAVFMSKKSIGIPHAGCGQTNSESHLSYHPKCGFLLTVSIRKERKWLAVCQRRLITLRFIDRIIL